MSLWDSIRNIYGHFHPALVHFPIALVLAGAAMEVWTAVVRGGAQPSPTGGRLLLLGCAGALLAAGSGLALFRYEDYRPPVLAAVGMHYTLALAGVLVLLATCLVRVFLVRKVAPHALQLWTYRALYWMAAILIGLAGHYGGWIVFGWGRIWIP